MVGASYYKDIMNWQSHITIDKKTHIWLGIIKQNKKPMKHIRLLVNILQSILIMIRSENLSRKKWRNK